MDTSLDTKKLTMALAGIRLGIGGALVVAPQFAARLWIGPGTDGAGTRVLARAIGARDVVLGYRTLQAVRNGESSSGWLELGAMADAADTVAGLLAFRGIPGHRRFTMPIVAGAVGAACFLVARRGAGDADRAAEQVEPDGGASRSTEAPATRVAPDHIDLDELVAVAGAISADGGAFSAGADAPEPASALRGVDAGRELDDASAAALLDVTIDRIDVLVSDGVLTPASEGPRRFHRTEILAARLAGG